VSTTVLLLDADGPAGARLAGRLSLDGYAAALARSVAHAEVIARRGPIDVLVLCDAGSAVAAVNLVRGVRGAATALAPTVGIVVVTAPEHAVAALEASTPEFVTYARAVVENAKTLGEELTKRGFDLVTGGTDNHLLLVDLTNKQVTGKVAAQALDKAGIVLNYNAVPFDPRKPGEAGRPGGRGNARPRPLGTGFDRGRR